MKYMGSKNRIAKHILPIILKDRKEGQCYVEPFVGGANIIDKVDGWRIGSDSNKYLIAFLKELQTEWIPPKNITKDHYLDVKDNPNKYEDYYIGYIGFMFSFGAKWFGGFVGGILDKGKKRDRIGESYRNAIKTKTAIMGIGFRHNNYSELEIPKNSIIYCDPPYKGTTGYKDFFNHNEFYQWCREKKAEGHQIFISEYNMPYDFECVWSKEISNTLTKKGTNLKPIEKLFTIKETI